MNNINPTHQYINEWKVLDETNEQGQHYLAHRYNILTTSYVCYGVYEPSALMGNHSSLTHTDEHGWLGDVTTRRLPASLDALTPGSQERSKAVTTYLDGWKAFAESLIRSAFPQDFEKPFTNLALQYAERKRRENNIAVFFKAVYDYSRTIVSDYMPQPHDWIYGSSYRPISASWARIAEAHYIQVDHRANNGVYTWVVVPYCLDEQTLAGYELKLLQEPK